MPTWSKPPEEQLHDALQKVWNALDIEVATDPSFDAVVGLQPQQLTAHAVQAVAAYVSSSHTTELSPAALIHVYTLGFVVGSKFGEERARRMPSDHIT
jgi:hypothetical protein